MISYQDIENANKTLISTDIKGKSYIEVNQRIKAFRMVYPMGPIKTELLSNENGICIFRALVGYYTEDGSINWLGTGTAYEKENSSFINKTSYIENAETSAVGRALGMAGFGIDTSVASFEEVANAIQQQESEKSINKTMEDALRQMILNNGIDNETVIETLKKFNHTKLSELLQKEVTDFRKELE